MTLQLRVNKREEKGKKNTKLREDGKIPAVLYGHKVKNINLSVMGNEFRKIYKQAGESTLVDLSLENEKIPIKVIIQDVQRDPVREDFLHIDFHQVNMKEKLHTHINLSLVGEAPAVKAFGAVLVTNKYSIEVKCLPSDLVSEIPVDLSSLKNLEDSLRIKDLKIPKEIEVLDNPDEIVVIVTESKTEKEAEKMAQAPVEAKVEPEVIGKKEKEAEEVAATEEKTEKKAEKKSE